MLLYKLIKNELHFELKSKSTLSAIFLYNVASFYLVSQLFSKSINAIVWAALFILIQLFGAINAVTKSFVAEANGRILYYAQIANSQSILLTKTIANFLLLSSLSFLAFALSGFFFQFFIQDYSQFVLLLLLINLFWAVLLTFLSCIAMKTNNSNAIMAIISLPMLIPFASISMKLFKICIDGLAWSVSIKYFILLISLIFIVGALSFLLFQYIWRD